MSAALLRQALDLVNEEERESQKCKKTQSSRQHRSAGQDHRQLFKKKKIQVPKISQSSEKVVEENLKKLLALSKPAADNKIAVKIIERAVKGKAIAEKIEINTEEPKSILFPEESFKSFEKQYFCR